MTDLRSAAQQALERLRKYHHGNGFVEDAECIAALEAALAQQEPRNQCGETCERAKLCATCAQALAQQAEPKGGGNLPPPLQAEPVAWRCACGANLYIDAQGRPASKAEPVQEPVAWRFKAMIGLPWSLSDDGYYISCKRDQRYFVEALYTAPPQRKPLSLTDLQEALVLTNLIDRDAIDDSEEYDEGSTLAQIDELYRIIKERV